MIRIFLWKGGRLETPAPGEAERLARSGEGILWIDLEAPDAEERALLSRLFPGHPLAVEDCLAESKVPKLNVHGELVFLVIHGSSRPEHAGTLATRELDLLWDGRLLVTYHAHALRSVEAVRERVAREPAAVLGRGPAWTVHAILDVLVDNWFPFAEAASERLAGLERRLLRNARPDSLEGLQSFSRGLATLLAVVDRQRGVFERLSREDVPHVHADARAYFRNLQDRAVLLHMELELQREQLRSLREAHLLSVSNSLNQAMKALTVASTVLMSMTLVTGIYGMNFRNMPELEWAWGYPAALGLMALVAGGTWLWIRKRGWV